MNRNAVGAGCAPRGRTKCAPGTPNYTVVILTRLTGVQRMGGEG